MSEDQNNPTLRLVTKEDSRRVWEIRNHPVARKYSANSEIIPYENHVPWFEKKYFSGQKNKCFVLVNEHGLVIGYSRYDFDEKLNQYEISIALDPEFHGKGLGYKLLSESLLAYGEKEKVLAEIQKDNIPSMKLFEKNNFVQFEENEKNNYLIFTPGND